MVILTIAARPKDAKDNWLPKPIRLSVIHPDIAYELEVPMGEWGKLLMGGKDTYAEVVQHWDPSA